MIRINLAPPKERRPVFALATADLGVVFGALFIAAVLGIGAYWLVLWRDEIRLTREVDQLSQEALALKRVIGQNAGLQERVGDLKRRVATIQALAQGQARPMQMLDAFASMLPPDIWITAVEEKNATLKVTGSAYSSAAVTEFMVKLRASGKFKAVDILLARDDLAKIPRLVIFEVSCRFEA